MEAIGEDYLDNTWSGLSGMHSGLADRTGMAHDNESRELELAIQEEEAALAEKRDNDLITAEEYEE